MAHQFKKIIQFFDTDAMGVVYHGNYLKYFEEARTNWLKEIGLMHTHWPESDVCFAVVESGCRHFAPASFGDQISIDVEVQRLGNSKVKFQYAVRRIGVAEASENSYEKKDNLLTTGFTIHVPVNSSLKACRLPKELADQLEKESWTETWP